MVRFTNALVLVTVAAGATASSTGHISLPSLASPSLAASPTTPTPQVPLLFVVDGVRYQQDHVPQLTRGEIFAVRVIRGRAALEQYGPDASYGVVVITTRRAVAPQS
jgi:hypothetical protein